MAIDEADSADAAGTDDGAADASDTSQSAADGYDWVDFYAEFGAEPKY